MTVPSAINLHRKSRILELVYPDGQRFELDCELLRVYSPSAEVRGHGPGQEVLQVQVGVQVVALALVGPADAVQRVCAEQDSGQAGGNGPDPPPARLSRSAHHSKAPIRFSPEHTDSNLAKTISSQWTRSVRAAG